MFEVLLGYITELSDMINYIIESFKSIFTFAKNVETENKEQSDEELLQSKSLFND